jgi:hypothetical protein
LCFLFNINIKTIEEENLRGLKEKWGVPRELKREEMK